jgi:hypothetical protein
MIVLGLLTTAGTIALDKYLHETAGSASELSWGWATLLKVLDHVGLGFFSVAILGLIIELRHMRHYFQSLIEKTIIKKEFIKTLRAPEQEKMQKQSLEAFFGIDELGKKGDFYDFYVQKIRSHIGGPFRKDTTFQTTVEPGPDNGSYKVTEIISYKCRKRGESIQSEVGWTAEQDEIDRVLGFEVTATKPDQTTSSFPAGHRLVKPYPTGHGYTLSLQDYRSCDGLTIIVHVTYLVSRERPFSWSMPYLSDGFSGEIRFRNDVEIFVDLFGMDKSALPEDKTKLPQDGEFNVYKISHQSWLLPDDGFSYYFRKKSPVEPPATPVASNT